MTQFLIARFVRDNQNTADPKVRERYGLLSSVVGVCCNVVLFLIKFTLGTLSGSIAITADAFNNLSDVGSCLVTMLGFKMGRPSRRTPTIPMGTAALNTSAAGHFGVHSGGGAGVHRKRRGEDPPSLAGWRSAPPFWRDC